MKAYVSSIEVVGRGEATLIVEVDLTDGGYERSVQFMDRRERFAHVQSDKYREYLEGLKKQISKLHVGNVELVYPEEGGK